MSAEQNRNRFTFFRSYYEALKELPAEHQGEVSLAIMEYALNGVYPDDSASWVVRSTMRLLKPTLDLSIAKSTGGKNSVKVKNRAKKKDEGYTLTPSQEVDAMLADTEWRISTCQSLGIDQDTIPTLLTQWLEQCKSTDKSHANIDDAKTHFRHWYKKQRPVKAEPTPPVMIGSSAPVIEEDTVDYTFAGGFGGLDI